MAKAKHLTRKKEVQITAEGKNCSSDCSFYSESAYITRCGDREYNYYCSLYNDADIEDDKRVAECVAEFGVEE
jgi:hypothetical protein